MFKRKCYHFVKRAIDYLIKIGIGGSLGVLIGNLFVVYHENNVLKVLSILFLSITIISFVVREIIRVCENKVEINFINQFAEFALKMLSDNEEDEVKILREAKVMNITSQENGLRRSIMLSALNCDIVNCNLEGKLSVQDCIHYIAKNDIVSVVLQKNNIRAIMICDGLGSWGTIRV